MLISARDRVGNNFRILSSHQPQSRWRALSCALVQCPVAVECNLNDPHCLFRHNSNSLVVFVTYSDCPKTMEDPVIFINILFRRPYEPAAVSYKVPDVFREISRKCIIAISLTSTRIKSLRLFNLFPSSIFQNSTF